MGASTSDGELVRIEARTATEVGDRFALELGGRERLRPGMTPGQFIDALAEAGAFVDAIRFLAHALPKREAVWWACLCGRQVAGAKAPAAELEALAAAEAWVVAPTEANRRAAESKSELAGYGTAAGCAAVSAFWSGGSLGPPHVAAIPPGEHLTAHGASCSVMLAAVAAEPEQALEKFRAFLARGLQVARGEAPWPASTAVDPRPEPAAPSPPQAKARNLQWD